MTNSGENIFLNRLFRFKASIFPICFFELDTLPCSLVLTKEYLKKMQLKGKGKILNVASVAGFMPGPLMATYYATKAYVVRLSEAIREELKKEKSDVQIMAQYRNHLFQNA